MKSKLSKGVLVSFLLMAASFYFFIPNEKSTKQEKEEKGPGLHPKWVEQWRLIKGLKDGEEVPPNLFRSWSLADKKANKREANTGLLNIKELGPYNVGGRTRDMITDYADHNRILACGVSGGIWESKNLGKKWAPINDNEASLAPTAITQSPFDHKIFYYSTGEVTNATAGVPGNGVFKSVDGGQSFSQLDATLNGKFDYTWDIKHSLTDSNTIYVATANSGLWRSTNAGDTFELVYQTGVDVQDIEVLPNGSVLITVESNGIYKSESGDLGSFTKLTKGTPVNGFNRIEISNCLDFPDVIYAAFSQNNGYDQGICVGIWKSSNGGKTWNLASGNPMDVDDGSFRWPWSCFVLGVHPSDTNNIVVGCIGLFFSKDGGASWGAAANSHVDYHCFTSRLDDKDAFLIGNDGGIYSYNWNTIKSTAQIQDLNNGYNVTQAYAGSFAPDSLGNIIGTQDNGTNYGQNGESDFTEIFGGDGSFCHVNQQYPDIAYVSSQNANIRKTGSLNQKIPSTISAVSDDIRDDSPWFINPFEMNYLDGELLFMPTQRGLWMSFDGAQFWSKIVDRKNNLYAVGIPYVTDPKRIYVGGDNLQLFRIEDPINTEIGNEISLRKNIPAELNGGFISCITVHNRNDGTLYLSLSNFSNAPKVWRVDSAHTDNPVWANISGDLPEGLPANWIELDPYRPDNYLMVATDFGLYTTSNGGQNWVKEDKIPNVSIHNIRMRYTDRKLFVYTHGRGTWAANLERIEDPYAGLENKKHLKISVFPNPAKGEINIELSNPFSYEITGLDGKNLLSGKSVKSIDVSTLPKGTYILKATANTKNYTTRFVRE